MVVWKRCVLTSLASLLLFVAAKGHSQVGPVPAAPPLLRPVEPEPPAYLPAPPMSPNQRIAEAISEQLRHSGRLRHYQVNIAHQNGVVELTGQVTDLSQRDEVLRLVYGVAGVERVVDRMVPVNTSGSAPTSVMQSPLQLVQEAAQVEPPVRAPDGGLPEPTPIFQAGPGAMPNPAIQPPRMPPYAWPTYAPYNNYSRVAYPTLYPHEAFPFIGPFYPFPKVPLGWRSVQLQWMDGYWWYGKYATGHDWWRVRYR